MKKEGQVKLFLGKVKTHEGITSAIFKNEISETVYLSELGLNGDECADKRHHGGLDRALHYYPKEHYSFWREFYNDESIAWEAPGMGENISSEGFTEENVYLGDRFQLGETIIEVSQPRSPCVTLNKKWGVENLSYFMQTSSRCGWLFRVIQTGNITPEAEFKLIERAENSLTVKEVCDIFFGDPLNRKGLNSLMELESLSDGWKSTVKKRLETNVLENWSRRLFGG
ncbi:MOSC domain-containing protein [Sediminitomix flava]|uniref:MOSC domain-containing protein YiiM n=1 Tax=Sediminitomix flava TaxID=379075 RepID=A0A315Z0T8_SEDFL|nr:MOSC domain-containing protein [Sediminitomix flava]PWJ36172.1 MOSC domain-containing protein YiiM [Sediminitomix flava]